LPLSYLEIVPREYFI